jgi:iron complex outermembrane receptor protein
MVFTTRFVLLCVALGLFTPSASAQQSGTLVVTVRTDAGMPIRDVTIQIGRNTARTDGRGEATLQANEGAVQVRAQSAGLKTKTTDVIIRAGETTRIDLTLEIEGEIEEVIIVTATRKDTLIDDVPLRVEVVPEEEVDEKAAMTPGDVAMLMNETSGLRVQPTFARPAITHSLA